MRLLVIEDIAEIADAVRTMLERQNFLVRIESHGTAGLEALLGGGFDLAIVDLVLPGRDGYAICRTAREAGIDIPLMILTARDATEDRVRGLDAGADDYLVKPFSQEELAARVRALLRRGRRPLRTALAVRDLEVDQGSRIVRHRGRPVPLAPTEFRVLEFLAINANLVISRDQLLERIWGDEFDGQSNIVDVYMSAIRRKLASAGAKDYIQTVRGFGYTLSDSSRG